MSSHTCTQTERLATLEANMKALVGNGSRDGRMDKAEERIESNSRLLWIGVGLVLALQALIAGKLFM